MKLALDTNSYVALAKGEAGVLEVVRRARLIMVPFVVVGELRAGFRCGSASIKNESVFQRFLASDRVSVLCADEQTTHHYAAIFADLKKVGRPVPTNDLWIAALVLQHDLVLHSFDRHFRLIGKLPTLP